MKRCFVVAGLAYGDEGKGATVDALARQFEAEAVIRYNGGPQTAHNVITPEGKHHTFSQFGSASFLPGVKTHISRFMLVNPMHMIDEAEDLIKLGVTDIWKRITVEEKALIVTPFHRATNRITEICRGKYHHGSCGQGIGECRRDSITNPLDALYAEDLRHPETTKNKLRFLQDLNLHKSTQNLYELTNTHPQELNPDSEIAKEFKILTNLSAIDFCQYTYTEWPAQIVPSSYLKEEIFKKTKTTIFEGAQGVLLDEDLWSDKNPHTTWTNTTFKNTKELLLGSNYRGWLFHIGVLRSYFTRHGAGPLHTENPTLRESIIEPHNNGDGFAGKFRFGDFDPMAVNFALNHINSVDAFAVNHLDQIPLDLNALSITTGIPVGITSHGPTANDRTFDMF